MKLKKVMALMSSQDKLVFKYYILLNCVCKVYRVITVTEGLSRT